MKFKLSDVLYHQFTFTNVQLKCEKRMTLSLVFTVKKFQVNSHFADKIAKAEKNHSSLTTQSVVNSFFKSL